MQFGDSPGHTSATFLCSASKDRDLFQVAPVKQIAAQHPPINLLLKNLQHVYQMFNGSGLDIEKRIGKRHMSWD